jgi:hypothetical protein
MVVWLVAHHLLMLWDFGLYVTMFMNVHVVMSVAMVKLLKEALLCGNNVLK